MLSLHNQTRSHECHLEALVSGQVASVSALVLGVKVAQAASGLGLGHLGNHCLHCKSWMYQYCTCLLALSMNHNWTHLPIC